MEDGETRLNKLIEEKERQLRQIQSQATEMQIELRALYDARRLAFRRMIDSIKKKRGRFVSTLPPDIEGDC